MLTIEAVRRLVADLWALPVLSRIGLLVMIVAGALDAAVHLSMGDHAGHAANHGFGLEHFAHALGIVGMVLVLAGVVAYGIRRQVRRHGAANSGGLDVNAYR
jgi:hypothetical protein